MNKEIQEYYATHSFKYYLSICLLIKDEDEYLEEFLTENYKAGVEHFYIFDNNSKIPKQETIKNLQNGFFVDKCTVIDFSTGYTHMQNDCYAKCLELFGDESRWILFIDSDEFLSPLSDKYPSFKDYLKLHEDNSNVWLPWTIHNANRQIYKENKPVKERFPEVIPDPLSRVGKVCVQPFLVKEVFAHNAVDKFEDCTKWCVNENGEYVNYFQKIPKEAGYLFTVDHYITKSFEEWLEKIERGSCNPKYSRDKGLFFLYNQDMNFDVIATIFNLH